MLNMNKSLLNISNGLLLATSLFCASCGKSDRQSAEDLLNEAKDATMEKRFDDARHLIDSLRLAYPREFDVRREALAFEDSLNLLQTREELAVTDSIATFKAFEWEDMKTKFVLEKQEKYQTQGYYVLPRYAGSKNAFSFFPEMEETGKLLLVTIDANRKYSFTEVEVQETSLDNLSVANDAFPQFVSSLSQQEKADIIECYKLAVAFNGYQKAKEQKDKLSMKVRFFERKIKEGK